MRFKKGIIVTLMVASLICTSLTGSLSYANAQSTQSSIQLYDQENGQGGNGHGNGHNQNNGNHYGVDKQINNSNHHKQNGHPGSNWQDINVNTVNNNNGKSQSNPASQFFTFPNNFTLTATGTGTERSGSLQSFAASLNLAGEVTKNHGNHAVALLTGTLVAGDQTFSVHAWSFVKLNAEKHFTNGVIHIRGVATDQSSGHASKFIARLVILTPSGNDNSILRIIGSPAALLGPHIKIFALTGQLTLNGVIPVAPTALDHFAIAPISSPQAAGVPFNVTVTAINHSGSTLTNYTGTADITDTTGTARPTTTGAFTGGMWTGKINITKATGVDTLTFTDVSSNINGSSNAFSVFAGSLASIALSPSSSNVPPAGKVQFTANGSDRFGNQLSGLTFSWSLVPASLGSVAVSQSTSTANFTASSAISTQSTGGINATVGSIKSSTSQITVTPGASQLLDHFVISQIANQTVGVPFSFNVTAENSTGKAIPSYNGPMRLTDSTGSLNITISNGFSGGSLASSNINITRASSADAITALDLVSAKTGVSNSFVVKAGTLDHFIIGQVANQTAGSPFSFNLTAMDAFGNIKTDYTGKVTLSTNDGSSPMGNASSIAPSPYNFTLADAGQHSFTAILYNVKNGVAISATDSLAGKSGVSNGFDVFPSAVAKVTMSPLSVSVSSTGTAIFGADAFDQFGNHLTDARFNWSLNSTSVGSVMPALNSQTTTFTAATVTSLTVGKVTATAVSTSISASAIINVSP